MPNDVKPNKLLVSALFVKLQDIQDYNKLDGGSFPYPLIAGTRQLAQSLGMLDPDEVDKTGMPLTARCVSSVALELEKLMKKLVSNLIYLLK